jgi:hypothetical protein
VCLIFFLLLPSSWVCGRLLGVGVTHRRMFSFPFFPFRSVGRYGEWELFKGEQEKCLLTADDIN